MGMIAVIKKEVNGHWSNVFQTSNIRQGIQKFRRRLAGGERLRLEIRPAMSKAEDFSLYRFRALVLTGPQGCGKSTLAREVAKRYGTVSEAPASVLDEPYALGDLLADEPETLILDGLPSRKGLDTLTSMIAARVVRCRCKRAVSAVVRAPNFILCTGASDALPIEQGDRRFNIVEFGRA